MAHKPGEPPRCILGEWQQNPPALCSLSDLTPLQLTQTEATKLGHSGQLYPVGILVGLCDCLNFNPPKSTSWIVGVIGCHIALDHAVPRSNDPVSTYPMKEVSPRSRQSHRQKTPGKKLLAKTLEELRVPEMFASEQKANSVIHHLHRSSGGKTMNDQTPTRRLTAADFDQELLDLYDYYAHGKISKREFLDRAGKWAVGGLTAAAILGTLSPNYVLAQQVAEDDPEIQAEEITYSSPDGTGDITAYLVRPTEIDTDRPPAAILVVHENRGLNPYIRDVVRRLAKAGFVAMGPDGLSSLGGYPGNDDEGREMQRSLDRELLLNDFFAGFEFLQALDGTNGKVGATGFCYGGGVVNKLAVAYPEMAAGVPFYGAAPDSSQVEFIEAPLMIQLAALDQRINAMWPDFQKALVENDKRYQAYIYPGVNHGFHNDTTPRYDEAAAKLAEERMIAWFRTYLAG